MYSDRQDIPMTGFNDNHKSHLRATFTHVDELASEAVRLLDSGHSQSPFGKHIADASPVQQKVIADYAARVRAVMCALLKAHGIELPQPEVSAVWAARITLRAAQIAIEELGPRHMRGYGELSGEAVRELNGVVSELLDLLGRMESYLAQGAGRDLAARLTRLERTTADAQWLAEMERIITDHGLVEFRSTLEMLVQRLESGNFEIAVFGRVNPGKSSLLNYVLGSDALPVGVTPVTAVPVRIVYGAEAWGRVWFADAAPQVIALGRVAEFAAEHYNPSNARHVTRIQVELPAPALKNGITFVDTPGVGSLAASGAAEAMAYLPRCDLGIVLVDATSTLLSEDVLLVDTLYRAGARVMVLLSKADMLASDDRWRAVGHVERELKSTTGMEVPVHFVSVKGADTALCDHWLEQALAPCLRDHRKLMALSLSRKLGALRDAVITALERRLARTPGAAEAAVLKKWHQADRILSQALAEVDDARRQWLEDLSEPDRLVDEILREAAHNAAVLWKRTQEDFHDITTLLAASLQSRARTAATATVQSLVKIRASLCNALAAASAAGAAIPHIEGDDIPKAAGMPVLNGSAVIRRIVLKKPALAFLGIRVLYRSARKQLDHDMVKQEIGAALNRYRQELRDWRLRMLDHMRGAFIANSDLIRARLEAAGRSASALAPGDAQRIEDDLKKLRRFERDTG